MSKEGKLHLVESCSFPRSTYKNVTNDASFQNLKEAAQKIHGNKSKLTEASVVNNMKKTLVESKIDEEVQKRVLKGLQEAGADLDSVEIWQFPISKVNTKEEPNLNGRVYNKELWKNVIDKQTETWKGGCGLANHPADDEDGDFMKQSIVWLDGFIGDDDIVYGIGTFIGEGGALARQIISLGGRIGFSSSGYGDFLNDGITVDPDSYEIDRLADLVLNPSQGVYGDYRDSCKVESVSKKTNKTFKESIMKNNRLHEDEKIKSIATALEADDATKQLFKIADDEGVELKLTEGNEEFLSADLAAKLIAKVVANYSEDEFNSENSNDILNCIKDMAKDGLSEEDAKKMVEDEMKAEGVDEEKINSLLNPSEESDDEKSEEEQMSESEEDDESTEDEEADDEDDSEEEEIDEDMSLEEQLIVEHYSKSLKSIAKKSNELWEEKIQDLNNLTDKLSESKLSKNVKKQLEARTQKIVEGIMKEARAAIQEGFKAKVICSELGVSSISKLSNVKDKLEDYVALEECLSKASKEAAKYKSLYEEKNQLALDEAEESFNSEETINKLRSQIVSLKNELSESRKATVAAKRAGFAIQMKNLKADKSNNSLKESKSNLQEMNTRLQRKVISLNGLLQETEKTIKTLKNELFENRTELDSYKRRLRELTSKLSESKNQRAELVATNNKLLKEKSNISADLRNMKENQRAAETKKRIQEARARRVENEKVSEFFDTTKMFKESKNIDNFLDSVGVANKADYKSVKTLKEAENKYLFDNELLSDEANAARDEIDVPREDVKDLSDLFI